MPSSGQVRGCRRNRFLKYHSSCVPLYLAISNRASARQMTSESCILWEIGLLYWSLRPFKTHWAGNQIHTPIPQLFVMSYSESGGGESAQVGFFFLEALVLGNALGDAMFLWELWPFVAPSSAVCILRSLMRWDELCGAEDLKKYVKNNSCSLGLEINS